MSPPSTRSDEAERRCAVPDGGRRGSRRHLPRGDRRARLDDRRDGAARVGRAVHLHRSGCRDGVAAARDRARPTRLRAHGRRCEGGGRWELNRDPYLLETSVPGIFACGDVRFAPVKRVAAAVGEGSMAIAFVHQYQGRREPGGVVASRRPAPDRRRRMLLTAFQRELRESSTSTSPTSGRCTSTATQAVAAALAHAGPDRSLRLDHGGERGRGRPVPSRGPRPRARRLPGHARPRRSE